MLVSAILVFSGYQFWTARQQQTASQRILLYQQRQPVAVVHLWPAEGQLFVADLTDADELAVQPASETARLAYSFALGSWFDRAVAVDNVSVDRAGIAAALQAQSDLAATLSDDRLWWRFENWASLQRRRQASDFNCPLAILNAGQAVGLAGRVSAILESSVFTIIRKDNYSQVVADTQLFYDEHNPACAPLATALAEWARVEAIAVAPDDSKLTSYRSSMTLLVGEDLAAY